LPQRAVLLLESSSVNKHLVKAGSNFFDSRTLEVYGFDYAKLIRIYGPPVFEAIRELEKLAVDMPEVCITDYVIAHNLSPCIAKEIGGNKVLPEGGSVPAFFMQTTGEQHFQLKDVTA
jgi:hypothetical protein